MVMTTKSKISLEALSAYKRAIALRSPLLRGGRTSEFPQGGYRLGKSSNFFGAIALNAKATLIPGRLDARDNVNSVPAFWRTAMEYKGIRFEIVETTNPCCWKWIVFLDAVCGRAWRLQGLTPC
jgi:hypothetical protein